MCLRAAYGRNAWCGCSENSFYRSKWASPNLCECWLLTFAGKLDFGRVGATSATDLPKLWCAGVARKAWILPASGPLSTIAMPEICPRSLILFAITAKRLELAGNSVFKVGHYVVLPDEGMGPAALRVLSASDRPAFIVDAECDPV